jgi:hypothetical protein
VVGGGRCVEGAHLMDRAARQGARMPCKQPLPEAASGRSTNCLLTSGTYRTDMRNGPYELIVPPADYPGKRYRGRYAYEHRINWWRATGLNPDDFPRCPVHHKNEQKRDNRRSNLELMSNSDHRRRHARPVTMWSYVCLYCETTFQRALRGRQWKFCSRRCSGLYNHRARRKLECTITGNGTSC